MLSVAVVPDTFCGPPSTVCSLSRQKGAEAAAEADQGSLTYSGQGEEGNGRHNWEMLVVPVVAEACRKLLQPEANCILPGELAPGHRSLGSAKLHKSPGRCGQ